MTQIRELMKSMSRSYDWYYSHDYDLEKASKVCQKFDERMESDKDFKSFVQKFVTVRADPISSDREVLAFMKAFNKVGEGKLYTIPKEDFIQTVKDLRYCFGDSTKLKEDCIATLNRFEW